MSYTLFNQSGPIHHIASVQGMNDILDFIEKMRVWGPLKDFLETGETANPQGVAKDITMYLPYCSNSDVKATLLQLKEGMEKAGNWAGLSD